MFDLSKIPFTRYGSYLAVSMMKNGEFNSYLNGLKVRFQSVSGEIKASFKLDWWFCEDNTIMLQPGICF